MNLRQIEYLRYYIAALGLIDPTKDEVDQWRRRCEEEGLESTWYREDSLEGLKRLPLPDSKWWTRQEELADVVSTRDRDICRLLLQHSVGGPSIVIWEFRFGLVEPAVR